MAATDVATAVLAELHNENRRTDDLTKVMGTDLHYTDISITFFLNAVQANLAPAHTFTWPPPTTADALGYSIATLIGVIDANTTTP